MFCLVLRVFVFRTLLLLLILAIEIIKAVSNNEECQARDEGDEKDFPKEKFRFACNSCLKVLDLMGERLNLGGEVFISLLCFLKLCSQINILLAQFGDLIIHQNFMLKL